MRFRYKDYRANGPETQKTMTLAATEFIRRFLLHVLPPGFHRIRYYGWLGPRHRAETLARCRQLLGTTAAARITAPPPPADYRDRYASLTGVSLRACPVCTEGYMLATLSWRPGGSGSVLPDTS